MIRTLFFFILLLASVLLGVELQRDPGYLVITIHQWTIETTLTVAVFCLLILFILSHKILVLCSSLTRTPQTLKQWITKRRIQKAQEKTRRGLIEFNEGHWLQAKNHLIKALPNTDTPLLNYLTAARAAEELGDHQLRDDYLRSAQQSIPEAKIAVELTQAQLQLANQQWEQALATLRHLQDLTPHHPYVLKLLMNLYEEIKDWPQLIALLPELKQKKVISYDEYQRLQQHAYLQYIHTLIKHSQKETLTTLWEQLPKPLTQDTKIISAYGYYLLNQPNDTAAESLLRRGLNHTWDTELITLYGQIKGDKNQLRFAESLLKKHAHSAPLLLCLGRICYAQNLWGKAKIYLQKSLDIQKTPEAFLELGKLYEQLHEPQNACAAYREGLMLENGVSIKP